MALANLAASFWGNHHAQTRPVRCLLLPLRHAADPNIRIELNTVENAENRCRMTFVIENKNTHAVGGFKIDLALFNMEGTVYRRMVVDMGPVPPSKTIVKTFATDGDCGQLSAVAE